MKATLIAAANSGAGKTTVTLALITALRRAGLPVRSLKLGPDYIDPAFHAAASGQVALNLDAWAMDAPLQHAFLAGRGPLVIESAMGLFDGAGLAGAGSPADVAQAFDLPIVLVVDCARASQTIPALVEGIVNHRSGLRYHGLLLNNVGSDRHEALLRAAFARSDTPAVLGVLRRDHQIALPSRHLGLVQASETEKLAQRFKMMANWLERAADPATLLAEIDVPASNTSWINPPAQKIAIAKDHVFSFAYPHLLMHWANAGATLNLFSPMNDDAVPKADFVFLPGGYPELFAGELAAKENFMSSLKKASQNSDIYGECGGYMTLGRALIDKEGRSHQMAGLLDVVTSFETPKMTLGYRNVTSIAGTFRGSWAAHEFHYSTAVREDGERLFQATDPEGRDLDPMGLRKGRVFGSYAHLIAPRPSGL